MISQTIWKIQYLKVAGNQLSTEKVVSYWRDEICSIAPFYKSLKYLNFDVYTLGKVHPIHAMDTQSYNDKARIPTKLKILCGAYLLQSNRHEFNKN